MSRRDGMPRFERGERLGAGKLNEAFDVATGNVSDQSAYEDQTGNFMAPPTTGPCRVRYCTKDNHPGMGFVFEAYAPGVWDPDNLEWIFTCDADHTYKIIDQDYGVPEPAAGAQGYAEWQPSTTYGQILVVITMDCESRGACCS